MHRSALVLLSLLTITALGLLLASVGQDNAIGEPALPQTAAGTSDAGLSPASVGTPGTTRSISPHAEKRTRGALTNTQESLQEKHFEESEVLEARNKLRQVVTRAVHETHDQLVLDLGLTPHERAALMAVLVDMEIAQSSNRFQHAREVSQHERERKIAAVIGEEGLQQFVRLESHLPAYWEIGQISEVLQHNGAPLTDAQRNKLLGFLISAGSWPSEDATAASQDDPQDALEQIEIVLKAKNEFERHIMELAPSVLDGRQVGFLHEQYQYRADQRAEALNRQKRQKTKDPDEAHPVWYPAT